MHGAPRAWLPSVPWDPTGRGQCLGPPPLGLCLALRECLDACRAANICTNLGFKPILFFLVLFFFRMPMISGVSRSGAGGDRAVVYSGWDLGSVGQTAPPLWTSVHLARGFGKGLVQEHGLQLTLCRRDPATPVHLRVGHRSPRADLPPSRRHEEEPVRTRRFPGGFIMQSPAQNHVIPLGPLPPLLFCRRKARRSR